MRHIVLIISCLFMVSACSDIESERNKPQTRKDQRKDEMGKVTGEEGLFSLGGSKSEEGGAGAIAVNSYLWRATLDTLSFMPLTSADPFGGVVITDWYEDPKTPGERFKVNAIILDRALRADGVKVTLFKQSLEKGNWRDQKVDEKLATSLEDTILTRARQLKVSSISK